MTTQITKSVHVAANAQTVWDHLTQPELLTKWFHPATEPLAQGQDFTLVSQKDGERMCFGRVLEMDPPRFMKWDFSVGPLNGKMTTVEWHIEDTPGGTRLTLNHTGLPEDTEAYGLVLALDKGWHGFMGQLNPLLADAQAVSA